MRNWYAIIIAYYSQFKSIIAYYSWYIAVDALQQGFPVAPPAAVAKLGIALICSRALWAPSKSPPGPPAGARWCKWEDLRRWFCRNKGLSWIGSWLDWFPIVTLAKFWGPPFFLGKSRCSRAVAMYPKRRPADTTWSNQATFTKKNGGGMGCYSELKGISMGCNNFNRQL